MRCAMACGLLAWGAIEDGHIGMTANQVLLQHKGKFFPDNPSF